MCNDVWIETSDDLWKGGGGGALPPIALMVNQRSSSVSGIGDFQNVLQKDQAHEILMSA